METNPALPWHVNAIDSKRGRIVGDETSPPGTWDKLQIHSHNATVATVYRTKDARAICTAVNSHEELLEALKVCQVRVFMAEGCSPAYEQARVAIDRAIGKKVMP